MWFEEYMGYIEKLRPLGSLEDAASLQSKEELYNLLKYAINPDEDFSYVYDLNYRLPKKEANRLSCILDYTIIKSAKFEGSTELKECLILITDAFFSRIDAKNINAEVMLLFLRVFLPYKKFSLLYRFRAYEFYYEVRKRNITKTKKKHIDMLFKDFIKIPETDS